MLKERLHTVLVCAVLLTGFSGGVVAQEEEINLKDGPYAAAWALFLGLNTLAKNDHLVWQNWTNQKCVVNPKKCKDDPFVSSVLLRELDSTSKYYKPCNKMLTTSSNPEMRKLIPKNLSDNPRFCEQVFVNPYEMDYLKNKKLLSVDEQKAFFNKGGKVNVSPLGVEVKATWAAASAFKNASFDCKAGSDQIYLAEIKGECRALTGLHIISKVTPKWLWATFEPQYKITNPNRCNPKLYNACNDPYGSVPENSTGNNTQLSPELSNLFTKFNALGKKIPSAFKNYRLTGVQTTFEHEDVNHDGIRRPVLLGNSFIEFNAGVPPQESSCMTCHSYAARNIDTGQANSVFQKGRPSVGQPDPIPDGYGKLDFSWFLTFGVAGQPKPMH